MPNQMTEKEKMIAGLPYNSGDQTLTEERLHASRLTFQLNHLHPDAQAEREQLLGALLGKMAGSCFITGPFYCDYGYNITLGDNFYANYNLVILDCAPVTIGRNVLIGPNVALFAAGHPVHPTLRSAPVEFAAPITIGNDVWIGGNVAVNPGVTIGDNTVIGAGSVVVHDIPSNVVAVGNPCRVLREVTDEDLLYYFKKLPLPAPTTNA